MNRILKNFFPSRKKKKSWKLLWMLCHFCKTMKRAEQLRSSSLISPDGQVPTYSPGNRMQTQCPSMSFGQGTMSDLVCVCLFLYLELTAVLVVCLCVTQMFLSLSTAGCIFQVALQSTCFHVRLFLPSPNTFLCYINNLHLGPQIWGQETFTDVDFFFSLFASGEHGLQIMSLFLPRSKWLRMQIFFPPFNSISFCDPSMFSSPFF